ncbi:YfjI family protein [Methylobacterium sp. SyP6R]|uniref:YfjI family protein n=1 Tax=Methylobacterium sp. SyP6R TaxID=2718876 RepID=UPI001F176975|nr:YfjI family protein [Methylobacterium sp. SyP6R]MCF4123852.1 DUF3987 domain-containing protein [Methylobacterium sp. SyP6R]
MTFNGKHPIEADPETYERSAFVPASYRDQEDPDAWGEADISYLGMGRRPAPAFPLTVLGPWADWVEMKARGACAPPDYVAVALMACAGAAIANVRWPLAGATWSEPPILWCAEVGAPSSSKSPSMDAAFGLVRHAEDLMAADFDEVQTDFATRKQAAEARNEAWKADVKAAIKAGENPPPQPRDAAEPAAPIRPRIRVADVTAEKLGMLAAGLPRGLLLVRDELSGFIGGLDRYSTGGSDRAFAIEMYGGRSYVVDRVKNPEPVVIRHLSVGVLGGIQPERLSAIIEGPDDGLAARLLWCWPDASPDFRLARELHDDSPMQAAFARLTALAMDADRFGHPEPKLLRLTREAEDILEAFAREMARRAHEATGLFAGTLGKARGHALRIATVIDHLWWCARQEAEPEEVGASAMRCAVELLQGYFIPMSERVYGDASIPTAERQAIYLARHLRRTNRAEFVARDLRREIGGPLREADQMNSACEGLVEANLIRPRFTRAGPTKGKAAKRYEVNPVVFARLS